MVMNKPRIVKVFAVCFLGIAVLVGLPELGGSAIKKLKPGATYCTCLCTDGKELTPLVWELKAGNHCSVNGKACTGSGASGTLYDCRKCTVDADGIKWRNCISQGIGGSTAAPIQPGGMAPPPGAQPKVPQTVVPGMSDQILRRGIENSELLPGPPPGADASEPATGEAGK
jgi:hypothetical protein